MDIIILRQWVKKMFNKIQELFKDKKIYLVGGPIRDKLLGIIPNDWDCSTPLTPEEIEKVIRQANKKPYLVGKRFGTIGVKIDGEMIEITTFRAEKYKEGCRKPNVTFVKDITADLSRRDLTINAMASSGKKIIDPFGGRDDLNAKIIRCVGVPSHRFKEDPLRMLRAGRFASKLEFDIEEKTKIAVKQLAHKILQVSKERWVAELDKLLMTKKPSIGLNFFMETGLMKFIIPEMALQYKYDQRSVYHNLNLWEHTSKALDSSPADINLRWALFLHDVGKPFVRTDRYDENGKWIKTNYIKHDLVGAEIVNKIAIYLKWSNDRREVVTSLVKDHLKDDSPLREYDKQGKA